MTPTTVDPEIAKSQKAYEGAAFEFTIDRIEPERLFSFRWHPFAVDPKVDCSAEPTTLVEFRLDEAPGGVLLRLTESGFDGVPLVRRAKAFEMNEHGWGMQMGLIEKYVAQAV